jgi:hypothetical protein
LGIEAPEQTAFGVVPGPAARGPLGAKLGAAAYERGSLFLVAAIVDGSHGLLFFTTDLFNQFLERLSDLVFGGRFL